MSWVPSRKWMAAQVAAAAVIAVMWARTGSWDTEETVAAIGWLTQAATTYLLPNSGNDVVAEVPDAR